MNGDVRKANEVMYLNVLDSPIAPVCVSGWTEDAAKYSNLVSKHIIRHLSRIFASYSRTPYSRRIIAMYSVLLL